MKFMKFFLTACIAAFFFFIVAPGGVLSSGASLPAGKKIKNRPAPAFSVLESDVRKDLSQNRAMAAIKALKAYGPAARLSGTQFGQYNYIYAGALRAEKLFYKSAERYRLAYLFLPEGQSRQMALLDSADVYDGMAFYPEAEATYTIFLNEYGKKSDLAWRAHLALAGMLFRAGHYRQALQHYGQAGGSSPALFGKAAALLAAGHPKMAFDLFTSLAAGHPGYMRRSALARYSFGEACMLLGRTQQAKTYLGSLTGGRFSRRAACSLALIAEGQGDFDLAVGLFQKASGSADTETKLQALVGLARCSLKLGWPDVAIAALGSAARIHPYGNIYWKEQFLTARAMAMKGEYVRPATVLRGLLVQRAYAEDAMGLLQSLLEGALAHVKSPEKFAQFWHTACDCLMQRGRVALVFKAGERLKGVDDRDFVNIDLWVARNGDAKLRRLAAVNLAVYYAYAADGRNAAFFFGKSGLSLKDESTRRLRADIRYLNGNYNGALADLFSIKGKDLSGADLLLMSKVLPYVKDPRLVALVEKMAQKRKTVPAGLYLSLADALYGMGQKAKALEYYREAAAVEGSVLAPEDLKWALFRIQSIAQDPARSLYTLAKQGGLMGNYAQARIEEEKNENPGQ